MIASIGRILSNYVPTYFYEIWRKMVHVGSHPNADSTAHSYRFSVLYLYMILLQIWVFIKWACSALMKILSAVCINLNTKRKFYCHHFIHISELLSHPARNERFKNICLYRVSVFGTIHPLPFLKVKKVNRNIHNPFNPVQICRCCQHGGKHVWLCVKWID